MQQQPCNSSGCSLQLMCSVLPGLRVQHGGRSVACLVLSAPSLACVLCCAAFCYMQPIRAIIQSRRTSYVPPLTACPTAFSHLASSRPSVPAAPTTGQPRILLACAGRVKAQLAACGLSAAWRVGRWEAVDGYLQHMQTGSNEPGPRGVTGLQEAVQLDADERWEGRLGRLLSDVHHR